MSENEHTPGAVQVDSFTGIAGTDCVAHYQVSGTGEYEYIALATTPRDTERDKANVLRLAACWNACQGISTKALEGGVVEAVLAICRAGGALVNSIDRSHGDEGQANDRQ